MKKFLMKQFDIKGKSILDFSGFGSYDIGYKEVFDKLKDNKVQTVFLNNDISVSIKHLKEYDTEAVNSLTGEKGYQNWARRSGYVKDAKKVIMMITINNLEKDEKFQNLFNVWKKEFDAELKSKNNIAIDLITNSKQK